MLDSGTITLEERPKLILDDRLYRCEHKDFLDEKEKVILSELDRNCRSDGHLYELCFHNNDEFDTLGTLWVLYSEDSGWGKRGAYSKWHIGEGISP